MPPLSNAVQIAATSAGVTGTITVGKGAHLRLLTFCYNDVDGQPQIIELTWASSPVPLRFVPNIGSFPMATSGAALAILQGAAGGIPLDVVVEKDTVVTIKVTSNANVTVEVGLRWD